MFLQPFVQDSNPLAIDLKNSFPLVRRVEHALLADDRHAPLHIGDQQLGGFRLKDPFPGKFDVHGAGVA